jgi:hypothetical protein
MNDDTRLDEIASAVLDGEASEAERALADGDPRVAVRVETLRRVRAVIADVAPVDPDQREQAIAAALAVAADAGTGATVTSLAEQRRRRYISPRTLRIAGIAAALAVGFLVVSLIAVLASSGDGDGDGDGDFATGGPAGSTVAGAAPDEAEVSDLAGSDTTADGAAPSRGEHDAALAAPEAAAEDDSTAADDGAGDGVADDPQGDQAESAAVGPVLAMLPDLGEVAASELVDLAAPDGFDPDRAVGVTDEALACTDVITALGGADATESFVATVDDRRVAVTTTPDGVVVIDLVDCTASPAQ